MNCITLADIISKAKERRNLLKIDIEGLERKIILGTPKSVFENIKTIVMEYTEGLAQIRAKLSDIGFSIELRQLSYTQGHFFAQRED